MSNQSLISHVKKFTTFQWLMFIKILENKSIEDLKKIEKDKLRLYMLQNTNWYLLVVDLSIRISDAKDRIESFDDLPRTHDYYRFIELYVDSGDVDKNINFSADLDYSHNIAMSKMMYEQLKMYAPAGNSLGRLIRLYGSIDNKIKELFGLTSSQIAIFYAINNAKSDIYEPFTFVQMLELLKSRDKTIGEKDMRKFIATFSTTIKEYRLEARDLGISKNKIKSKRLIMNTPILDLSNSYYFIPSKFILKEVLTYKIFELINGMYNESETFKRNFGKTFENYIRELTYASHNDCFVECDTVIKSNIEEKKAEFFISKEDSSIVIESKLLHIEEDLILHGSAKQLDKKMDKRIKDALSQIESCFNYMDTKNKYGIIVIHTHIPMLDSLLNGLKAILKNDNKDNIILVSVIDFEVMIHNPYEKIIEYFYAQDKNIALFFNQRNSYLQKINIELIDNLRKQLV